MNTAIAGSEPLCHAGNDTENINDLVTEPQDILADDIHEFKTCLRTEVFIKEEKQTLFCALER